MKTEILKYLKETKEYLSGQELCERLGVSRTAVWKVIRQLQEEGYQIEAVRNRGYRLTTSGDVLTEAELKSLLHTARAGQTLVILKETDSTNNYARKLADQGAADGTLVLAEQQTAGKGRRGRNWTSPSGTGIWMSLLLRPEFAPAHASMLTLVAAMAVKQGIAEITGLDCQIKWPNDIVLNGKKICGILTEMSTEEDSIRHVVIGIGINVNIESFPEELRPKATSLLLEAEQRFLRAPLVEAVLRSWETYYETYQSTLDMSLLKEEYNRSLASRGQEVKVLSPKGDYTGVSQGINDGGELLVEMPDGELREVMSGEVSVRGIYGYV
ncbi:MAG: biotin--[acetyl-CoA-carboxylase] ligase [Lachnospiraceae bacterium]|nr:biotin--[acetyl-CoA-carboxylase] ligase [Lachnospiraceae bacterium]